MRALGPGSVSSFLKTSLDVVYVALWAAAAAILVFGLGGLLFHPFTSDVHHLEYRINGRSEILDLSRQGPMIAVVLLAVEAYLAALIVIFNRLRRVFETLTRGDPFRPENVGRLRIVGLALIALELLGYGVRMSAAWLLPPGAVNVSISINLSGWFAILVVFVLAEVFREGARLRGEAELTI